MGKITKISKLFLCTNLIFGAMAIFSVTNAMKSQCQSLNERCEGGTELAQSGATWEKKEGYDEYKFESSPKITIQCADSLISQEEKQQVVSCLEKFFNSSNNVERVYRLVKVGPNAMTCKCGNITTLAGVFNGLLVVRGNVLWVEIGSNGYRDGLSVELPPADINFSTTPSFVRTVGCASSPRFLGVNLPMIITAHSAPGVKAPSHAITVDRSKSPIGMSSSSSIHCERAIAPCCRGAQWVGINLFL